jgi:hypothetical protein
LSKFCPSAQDWQKKNKEKKKRKKKKRKRYVPWYCERMSMVSLLGRCGERNHDSQVHGGREGWEDGVRQGSTVESRPDLLCRA